MAACTVVLAAGAAAILIAASPGRPPTRGAVLPASVVTVKSETGAVPVPASFLSISTEYWTIPVWVHHLGLLGRVLVQLTPNGPLVLRIGGDSAAQSIWAPTPKHETPEWAFELSPRWLASVSAIVNRFHVRVILDLNLITVTPKQAAHWAATAEAKLPAESVIGFEIGNEPDIYSPAAVGRRTAAGPHRKLPPRMTAARYAAAYHAYEQALDRAVPNIPLLAPALASPDQHLSWIARLLSGTHRGLVAVTVHRYPLSACAEPGTPTWPTISKVLGEAASAGMAATVVPAVRLAASHRLELRLTEFNSVTCGGTRGVSDTFATALWAPDALFELVRAGAASAALHVRAYAINMAFALGSRGLDARPLFYGLATFARMLGPGARLLAAQTTAARGIDLKAWPVLDGSQLRVLLINKSKQSTRVTLRLPVGGAARIERLRAHSATSTSGVTLGGQRIDVHGQWAGSRVTTPVARSAGGYLVTVPGFSAAIVIAKLTHSGRASL
jgi:hypothetical protein